MPLIKVLFCLLILIFVLLAFGSTLLFWYEAKNAPEARVPAPDWGPVERGAQYFRTLASFFVAVALLPLGPFVRFFLQRPGPRERTDLPPIVMAHGLYHNASTWLYLAWALRAKGRRIRFFTYARSACLPDICARLTAFVRGPELQSGNAKPIVIGHSMGGLIARACLADGAFKESVAGIITLGACHAGSKVAVLALGNQARSLVPGSEFLRGLRDDPVPALPCISLAATADEQVLPASSLVPPLGWTFKLVGAYGHLGMLFSPAVCALLQQELEAITGC